MTDGIVFDAYQGALADLNGVTVTVAVLSLDDPSDLIGSMVHMDELLAWEIQTANAAGYVRQTIELAYAIEDGDGVVRYASGVPSFDLAGADEASGQPNAVVCLIDLGDDDASPVAFANHVEAGDGFDDWTADQPAEGLARVSRGQSTVPAGGTTGQALVKASDTDGDTEWGTVSGGGTDADLGVVAAALILHSATAVDVYEASATASGVSGDRVAATAATLPFVVTDDGDTQEQLNENVARLATYTLATLDLARDEAAASEASAVDALGTGYAAQALARNGGVTTTTVVRFQVNSPASGGNSHLAEWSTPAVFSAWTGGIWIRVNGVSIDETGLPAAPADGDGDYGEFLSQQYSAGDEGADTVEFARESVWSATLGRWRHWLYYEHTPIGDTTDSYKLEARNTGRIELPVGPPIDVAVWVQFDVAGESRGRLFMDAGYGPWDVELDGTRWIVAHDQFGDPTSIEANATDPWWMGPGYGRTLIASVEVRNEGPEGTLLASPTATDAVDADTPFDDAQSNTWTPTVDAALVAGTPAPSSAVSSVNGQTGTVVLDADDIAVDASGFSGNLDTGDTDLQAVADKVDTLPTGGDVTHIASITTAQTSRDGTAMNTGNGGQLIDTAVSLPESAAGDSFEFRAIVSLLNNSGAGRNYKAGVMLGTTFAQTGNIVVSASASSALVEIVGSIQVPATGTQYVTAMARHPLVSALPLVAQASESFTGPLNLQLYMYSPNATATQAAQLVSFTTSKTTA